MKVPVDEAPAGPEMDAAVAAALGWHFHYFGYWIDEDGIRQKPACIGCTGQSTWSPSTDIAAAEILWDKLVEGVEEGHSVSVCSFRDYEICLDQLVYGVFIDVLPCGPGRLIAKAETKPHAITRAFLKANNIEFVEVSDEDTG